MSNPEGSMTPEIFKLFIYSYKQFICILYFFIFFLIFKSQSDEEVIEYIMIDCDSFGQVSIESMTDLSVSIPSMQFERLHIGATNNELKCYSSLALIFV